MLSEAQVKGAKPKSKKYMLNDGRGLYLRVDPSGRKYWILRYTYHSLKASKIADLKLE